MSRRMLIALCAVLASATTAADAAVVAVSLPIPEQISSFFQDRFPHDVDYNGSIDFTLSANISGAFIRTERSNRIVLLKEVPPDLGGPVAAFPLGALIGANTLIAPFEFFSGDFGGDNFVAADEELGYLSIVICFQTCSYTPFAGHRAYAGFEFERDGQKHYGYFDLSGAEQSKDIILYGWAWETEPGRAIGAGAIPEPSTSVYIGGSALLLWQRNASHRKENKALQRTARGLLVSTLGLIRKCLGFGGVRPRP